MTYKQYTVYSNAQIQESFILIIKYRSNSLQSNSKTISIRDWPEMSFKLMLTRWRYALIWLRIEARQPIIELKRPHLPKHATKMHISWYESVQYNAHPILVHCGQSIGYCINYSISIRNGFSKKRQFSFELIIWIISHNLYSIRAGGQGPLFPFCQSIGEVNYDFIVLRVLPSWVV